MTIKDNHRGTFGSRLKQRMAHLDVTRNDVAAFTGISAVCLHQYIHDLKIPRPKRLKRLCIFLKVSSDWLLYGDGENNSENNQEFLTSFRDLSVPILKHYQVSDWIEHDILPGSCDKTEICLIGGKAMSIKSYAIRVVGRSMVSSNNPAKSLYDGDIVIVDPELKPKEGALVLCKISEHEARFRQYNTDGNAVVLQALDPQYPALYLTDPNVKIIGVVTQKTTSYI